MLRKLATVLLLLSFRALSLTQSALSAENVSTYIGNNRWEWTVFIWTVFIKTDTKTLSQIRCVQYVLHPTFPNRIRRICDRGPDPNEAFPLTANGWGVFDVPITITFADGHMENLVHHLHFGNTAPTPTATPTPSKPRRRSRRKSVPPARKPSVPAAVPTPSSTGR